MMTETQKQAARDFASELRSDVIAVEFSRQQIPRSKTMTQRHKDEVAEHFQASKQSVTGSKKLYPSSQPQIKRINAVLTEARRTWERMTIGYRKGVRLLRKDMLESFIAEFDSHQCELDEALSDADNKHDDIIEESRSWIREELFDINDYPTRFKDSVSIRWSVHNFEPSEELLKLAPETYKREQLRVREQFEAAIANYEDEMREQMTLLVESLLHTLRTPQDGKRVVFKEATANNLRDFFARYDDLGIDSDAALGELVAEAKQALGGVTMSQLKKSSTKRNDIAGKFGKVKDVLDSLAVVAPSRSINLDDLE